MLSSLHASLFGMRERRAPVSVLYFLGGGGERICASVFVVGFEIYQADSFVRMERDMHLVDLCFCVPITVPPVSWIPSQKDRHP